MEGNLLLFLVLDENDSKTKYSNVLYTKTSTLSESIQFNKPSNGF